MLMSYTLSMPNVGSWNGRWSGEGSRFVRVRSYRVADKPPEARRYTYDFGDGWCAVVDVEVVDAATARKLRRASDGFCGYDWMIDSVERHGRIFPRCGIDDDEPRDWRRNVIG